MLRKLYVTKGLGVIADLYRDYALTAAAIALGLSAAAFVAAR